MAARRAWFPRLPCKWRSNFIPRRRKGARSPVVRREDIIFTIGDGGAQAASAVQASRQEGSSPHSERGGAGTVPDDACHSPKLGLLRVVPGPSCDAGLRSATAARRGLRTTGRCREVPGEEVASARRVGRGNREADETGQVPTEKGGRGADTTASRKCWLTSLHCPMRASGRLRGSLHRTRLGHGPASRNPSGRSPGRGAAGSIPGPGRLSFRRPPSPRRRRSALRGR